MPRGRLVPTMRSWPLLLSLFACSPAPVSLRAPSPEAPPARPGCEAPPLLPGALLTEGHLLVLGEVHGTEASPRAAGEVVCQALAAGRRVVLALEIPDAESARLDAFLAGADRDALLAGPFWRRGYQDGRSSRAMVELLERARELRRAGGPLSVVAMDASGPGEDRDTHMAERVLGARRDDPQALGVVLVGNLHARAKLSLPRSMAWRLRKAGVALTAVWLEYGPGVTWMCDAGSQEGCGEHRLGGVERGPRPFFEVRSEGQPGGFDGVLYLGPMRASPPAFSGPWGPASPPRP